MADKHFIDEPYILQRVAFSQAADLLKPHAREGEPLPHRMRHKVARMVVQLSILHRELLVHPADVRREREAEDTGPPPRTRQMQAEEALRAALERRHEDLM